MKINTKQKIKLYSEMLRIRKIEEKISSIYHEQEIRCPVHLSIGQEAVAVGICNNQWNKGTAAIKKPTLDISVFDWIRSKMYNPDRF